MIAPEFRAVVAQALVAAGITDETEIDRVARRLLDRDFGWAWLGDAAGSTAYIPKEAERISADALRVIGKRPNAPTPAAQTPTLIFSHTPDEWRRLPASSRLRIMQAGLDLAARRGEDPKTLEARRALAEFRATEEQAQLVSAADGIARAAASVSGSRAASREAVKADRAKVAQEIAAANGPALQTISADARKLAAGGAVETVRKARANIATAERTLADASAPANTKAYAAKMQKDAEATLRRYGLAS